MLKNLDQHYTANAIRTYTGKAFDITILDPKTICIEDIAHALSRTPRWSGHTEKIFTVAQHSVLACLRATEKNKLAALLHDASEAYLQDIAKPIKVLLPDYQRLEANLMDAIAFKFGFDLPLDEEVKLIDRELLQVEWDMFVIPSKEEIEDPYSVLPDFWSPDYAKEYFLGMYQQFKKYCDCGRIHENVPQDGYEHYCSDCHKVIRDCLGPKPMDDNDYNCSTL